MSQTLALLVDAYRDVNSRKLFWITLVLSGAVVLCFLALGITPHGMTIFGFEWKDSPINSEMMEPATFYKILFIGLGVQMWLTFVAAILALISTGGIFPDLLGGGSIDLYLSKPISRLRLFITKYFAGLLFATLQVAAFAFASLILLRIKSGAWLPGLLLAIPTVLAYYSYLYCVCVLIGVVTRSTVASILLTILFMFVVGGVHSIESKSLLVAEMKNQIVQRRVDRSLRATPAQRQAAADEGKWLQTWHRRLYVVAAALPKTSATVELMQRWLISAAELPRGESDYYDDEAPRSTFFGLTTDDERARLNALAILRARPLSWVLGTSFIFEGVVLAVAAWIFCRRDY